MDKIILTIWIISLILVLALIVIGTSLIVVSKESQTADVTINYELVSQSCSPAKETLPNISTALCCVSGGILTTNKYLTSLDMVVSQSATYYETVCAGFCQNGFSDGKCNGGIGQDKYTACISKLKPEKCKSPGNPVATDGINYYYGYSAGKGNCLVEMKC